MDITEQDPQMIAGSRASCRLMKQHEDDTRQIASLVIENIRLAQPVNCLANIILIAVT